MMKKRNSLISAYFRVDESVEASEYNAYKKKYKVLENSAIYVLKEDEKGFNELLEGAILAVLTFSMLDEEYACYVFTAYGHTGDDIVTISRRLWVLQKLDGNEQLNIFDFIKSGY